MDEQPAIHTTLEAMEALVQEHLKPQVIATIPGAVLVTSNRHSVHDLEDLVEKHLEHPKRPKGTSVHHTLASLIEHAQRHKTTTTAVYCVLAGIGGEARIRVVYNAIPVDGARGGWGDHRAEYAFPYSDQWKRWTQAAKQPLSVADFAELLENGISDVRDATGRQDVQRLPGVTYATPAELLKLAEGLHVRVEQQAKEQRKLDNGTSTLVFAETHTNEKGEPLRVPNGFLLGIPVFLEGAAYAIPVRLRYEIRGGQILWRIQLHDAAAAQREAITEAAKRVATETGLPLYYGTPE